MLFNYKAIDASGRPLSGSIEALNIEVAINALQRRGFVLSTIAPEGGGSLLSRDIALWRGVGSKDIVLLSRELATLFEAQVPALRIFRMLASEIRHPILKNVLVSVADELQAGSSISNALAKHPKVFSNFYVQMVRSGEEAGKLDQIFEFLAEYLERTYEVTSKARNALVYPIFVLATFFGVMALMLTTVIPNISGLLVESGQELPIYTKAVLALSSLATSYGFFLLGAGVVGGFFLWRFSKTEKGKFTFGEFKIRIPLIGSLYRELYLSRIADNLHIMLLSAIPIIKALEITAEVVDNPVYAGVLRASAENVKGGSSIADALSGNRLIPGLIIQMVKVGEESGELVRILEMLGRFYRREVTNAVDTLVGLIEPMLIVTLGLAVGFLLAAVLLPIYQIAGGA